MSVHTGSPQPTTLNGYHANVTPQSVPAAPSLQGPPAPPILRRPAPKRKLDLHGTQFLIPIVYIGALVIASFGGVEAASPKFGLVWYLTLPLWLFIEAVGVLMMAIAKKELVKGRKTLAAVAAIASAAIAGGVAWLNFTGHSGNPWVASIFGGASVAAYGTFVLSTIDSALDAALISGRRERKGYRYPLAERLRHPARSRLAAEIMARNPGITPADARLAAVDHPIMLAFIRARLRQDIPAGPDGTPGRRRSSSEVEGILHVLEPHTLVPMFREQMGPYRADLVKKMVDELGAKNLLGPATTRQRITPPRVDAAALTAAAGTRVGRPSKQATNDPTNHTPLAVADAATIRSTYPDGLPERGGQRKVRDDLGWHATKATNAVNAYWAGADLTSGSTGLDGRPS